MRPDGRLSDQRNAGAVSGAVPAGDRAGHALAFLRLSGLRPADHGSGGLIRLGHEVIVEIKVTHAEVPDDLTQVQV